MAIYEITGGAALHGEVTISGAKNAAVAILPAAILVGGKCRVENVPDISDVQILLDILASMGVGIHRPEPGVVELDSTELTNIEAPAELVRKMRASSIGQRWRCPAAVILLPGPSISISRASVLWARMWKRQKNMSISLPEKTG